MRYRCVVALSVCTHQLPNQERALHTHTHTYTHTHTHTHTHSHTRVSREFYTSTTKSRALLKRIKSARSFTRTHHHPSILSFFLYDLTRERVRYVALTFYSSTESPPPYTESPPPYISLRDSVESEGDIAHVALTFYRIPL